MRVNVWLPPAVLAEKPGMVLTKWCRLLGHLATRLCGRARGLAYCQNVCFEKCILIRSERWMEVRRNDG